MLEIFHLSIDEIVWVLSNKFNCRDADAAVACIPKRPVTMMGDKNPKPEAEAMGLQFIQVADDGNSGGDLVQTHPKPGDVNNPVQFQPEIREEPQIRQQQPEDEVTILTVGPSVPGWDQSPVVQNIEQQQPQDELTFPTVGPSAPGWDQSPVVPNITQLQPQDEQTFPTLSTGAPGLGPWPVVPNIMQQQPEDDLTNPTVGPGGGMKQEQHNILQASIQTLQNQMFGPFPSTCDLTTGYNPLGPNANSGNILPNVQQAPQHFSGNLPGLDWSTSGSFSTDPPNRAPGTMTSTTTVTEKDDTV